MSNTNKGRGRRDGLVAMSGLAALLVLAVAPQSGVGASHSLCADSASGPATPALQGADAVIEVTRESDGNYQLTLEVQEAIGVGKGQQLLLPTATKLCDGLPPRFGTYEFSTTTGVGGPTSTDSFVLVQDIECGGAGRSQEKPPSRQLGAEERSEIERAARTRAVAYFQALSESDDRGAFAMFSDSSPSASVDEDWRSQQAGFRAKAGPLSEIDVWKVTLYVDSPSAPERGIYVATDLEVSYENLIVCGYLVWLEDPDGTLRITRQDVGVIAADVVSRMSASQLAKVRSDFRCRPDTEPE